MVLALLLCTCHAFSSGKEANDAAMQMANMGNYPAALKLFQTAVELAPDEPDYICNVGVTYMRMQQYANARKTFMDALAKRPGHPLALDNLRQLTQFDGIVYNGDGTQGPSSFKVDVLPSVPVKAAVIPPLSNIRHKVQPLPQIPLAEMLQPYNRDYLNGKKPFKLVNFTQLSQVDFEDMWDFEYFGEEFADYVVDFYPYNMPIRNIGPVFANLPEALAEIEKPSGRYRLDPNFPGSYALWNMDAAAWAKITDRLGGFPSFFTSDDAWLKGCFGDDTIISSFQRAAHWRMVLFGSKGAGMFNHMDTLRTASFQIQLSGIKRWHICGPSENHKMYEASDVNAFAPDYDRYPLFLDADCYLDEVRPGETLFYPMDYWHQTLTITDFSVSMTGTLVDQNCYQEVIEELHKKCRAGGSYDRVLCDKIYNECEPWWHNAFGGVFKPFVESVCPL